MSRFEELWEGYIAGTLKSSEVQELLGMINRGEESLEGPVYSLLDDGLLEGLAQSGEKEMILQRIMEEVHPVRIRPVYGKRIAWAAAAAILLCCMGAYIWQHRPEKKELAQDILPGGSKAVLTLINGATVMLDSSGNQSIQQGASVVQQQGGRLQYLVNRAATGSGFNTLTTPHGGQYQVILPDGTKVWLNSASSLKYPIAFTGKERTVELKGEGYFEVEKSVNQTFKVNTNNITVQVLGTHFNIMAYPDEPVINTTLEQGAVLIITGKEQQKLEAGQQAILNNATGVLTLQPADVEVELAWKDGFFEFDNMELSKVMRQLARWYNIEVIDQTNGASKKFGGRIGKELKLAEVLKALERNGAHFKVEGRKVTVLPSR